MCCALIIDQKSIFHEMILNMKNLEERSSIRRACTKFLYGHKSKAPSDEWSQMAAWCAEQDCPPDTYGQGKFLQEFEAKIAALLGKEAAVFMPSGTMAQQMALRVWCDYGTRPHIGLHPASHLELHEFRGYEHLHGLRATILGTRALPLTAADLSACPEPLAAVVAELPLREAGGSYRHGPNWKP